MTFVTRRKVFPNFRILIGYIEKKASLTKFSIEKVPINVQETLFMKLWNTITLSATRQSISVNTSLYYQV